LSKPVQIAELLRELQDEVTTAKLRYEMAKRDREEAFAKVPSPSPMMH
jgi:hypothetical protein